MNTPQAYPLQWPAGWPRTDSAKREKGSFKTTLEGALRNLKQEVTRMGGKNPVLSSNCALGQTRPADPGVVAYFEWHGKQLAIPCDRWTLIEHNVQAIALTIQAMRGMERWGAKHMIEAMFTGFKLLPNGRAWHDVLDVSPAADPDFIVSRYREMARQLHPDKGGNHEKFIELQNAFEEAKRVRGFQ